MVTFLLLALLLVALALAWLLPVLWRGRASARPAEAAANVAVYRDQLAEAERDLAADLITPERYEQLRAEIEHRVLDDTRRSAAGTAAPAALAGSGGARASALVLALALPLASIGLYRVLGSPAALEPTSGAAAGSPHAPSGAQIEQMVSALAKRLEAEPNNAEGWTMLGRSYVALGRFPDAVKAYERLAAIDPKSADALADWADALAMAQGRTLAGEPLKLIERALALDPGHVKALALAGTAAFDVKDYAKARSYWERLVASLPPEAPMRRSVEEGIAEARALERGEVPPSAMPAGPATVAAPPNAPPASPSAAPSAPPTATAGAARAPLTGEATLSPDLAARVAAGDTVFVFARAAEGPRIPLAIARHAAGTWPLRFSLDDKQSMTPERTLTSVPQVVVGVRVSKSGNATPQSGDLFGQSAPVAPDAQNLRIVIDRVQP